MPGGDRLHIASVGWLRRRVAVVVALALGMALLVAPGAIAFLISRRFAPMMMIATVISVICSLVGIYDSFFIDSAPAPTIVLLMSATFIVTFILTTRRPTPALSPA